MLPPSPGNASLEERRNWIVSVIDKCLTPMDYDIFLGKLGLPPVFDPFAQNCPDLFQSLAKSAPAFDNVKMSPTSEATPSGMFSGADFYAAKNEAALVAYFKQLVKMMYGAASEQNERYERAEELDKLIPEPLYNLGDHQATPIRGGKRLKMDLAFTCSVQSKHISNAHIVLEAKREEINGDIGERTFKQVADYQYLVWETQPTRTFVP
ncbi:hypothetical protein GGF44_006260, partial [Coemansia sp. RSA 1694]